jgi:hypothetical protein
MMDSESDSDRVAAATALWTIKRHPASIPVLIRNVADVETVHLLGRIGPPARAAIPALLQELRAKYSKRRCDAAVALWRIAAHEAAVPILLEGWMYNSDWLWHDPDNPMRQVEADPELRAALEKRYRQEKKQP